MPLRESGGGRRDDAADGLGLLGEFRERDLQARMRREGRVWISALGGHLDVHDKVYFPVDWHVSFLADRLGDVKGKHVLDLGTGTGVNAILAAKRGAIVTATDYRREAVLCATENVRGHGLRKSVTVLGADMFRGLEGRSFDVILFTPSPRSGLDFIVDSPSYRYTDHALKFLGEAPNHLNPGGRILYMHSHYPAIESSRADHGVIEGAVRRLAQDGGFSLNEYRTEGRISLDAMLSNLRRDRMVASEDRTVLYELTKGC